MSAKFLIKSVFALMLPFSTLCGLAQMPNPYSLPISLEKAKMVAAPALNEARKNNVFQETLAAAGDGLRVLGLQGAVPIDGGIPLLIEGNIVGAIGVSGATSQQDGQCAKAGADTLK
jgi:glc operon protein GlcG